MEFKPERLFTDRGWIARPDENVPLIGIFDYAHPEITKGAYVSFKMAQEIQEAHDRVAFAPQASETYLSAEVQDRLVNGLLAAVERFLGVETSSGSGMRGAGYLRQFLFNDYGVSYVQRALETFQSFLKDKSR